MCDKDVEHLLHVFMDCEFAKECWRLMGAEFDFWTVESAPEWVLGRLESETSEVQLKLAKVLWGIWNARNFKVWEHKVVTPSIAMQWSDRQISQWQEVRKKQMRHGPNEPQQHQPVGSRWVAPAVNRIKVNMDASVVSGAHSFSLGLIIRDHQGEFITAKNLRYPGEITVFEAEVRGILEAVTWLEELQLSGVDIETDSLLAVKALKMGTEYNLEVGDVLAQCRSILDARPDFAIYFVKRQANMAAHLIARAPCMVNCFNVFMSPPDFLLETLMFDLVLS
ncbi:uncharacterized protein LOC108194764 [Daucus carota subsp. sativus]|uniref:uncharacterized protein LOC108194764 n=1 Tax=Daucus carota subsp. sativus TaxID=79200 RepID=UPI00308272F4